MSNCNFDQRFLDDCRVKEISRFVFCVDCLFYLALAIEANVESLATASGAVHCFFFDSNFDGGIFSRSAPESAWFVLMKKGLPMVVTILKRSGFTITFP